jgi:hypothetical protein
MEFWEKKLNDWSSDATARNSTLVTEHRTKTVKCLHLTSQKPYLLEDSLEMETLSIENWEIQFHYRWLEIGA